MDFKAILNLVMMLFGNRGELVSLITDAIALFNKAMAVIPPLKQIGQGATDNPMSVTWLQESLNKLVDAGLTVDGKYGMATQEAVKKFQAANGLTPDGWAGVLTQATIVNALKPVVPAGV